MMKATQSSAKRPSLLKKTKSRLRNKRVLPDRVVVSSVIVLVLQSFSSVHPLSTSSCANSCKRCDHHYSCPIVVSGDRVSTIAGSACHCLCPDLCFSLRRA